MYDISLLVIDTLMETEVAAVHHMPHISMSCLHVRMPGFLTLTPLSLVLFPTPGRVSKLSIVLSKSDSSLDMPYELLPKVLRYEKKYR